MGNKAYRGVDKFYVAKVLSDEITGIAYDTPYNVSAVQHVTREVGEESAKVFADNKAALSIKGAGSPTATFTVLNIPAKDLAILLGQAVVGDAMVATNVASDVYFGIMYRLKNSDGSYTYVAIGKAKFKAPSDDVETQNDGTDVTLMSLETEIMGTIAEFDITENGITKKGSFDYIKLEETDGKDYSTSFFASMPTPATIGTLQEGGTVATPTASPDSGEYTGTQSVTLACSTEGASIYYTTDGTTPTSSSTLYESAISVSASESINAVGIKQGMSNSAVKTAYYIINE